MSSPSKYENVTEGLHLCIQILAVQWNELECAAVIFFDNVWLIIYFWLEQSVREIHLNSFVRTLYFSGAAGCNFHTLRLNPFRIVQVLGRDIYLKVAEMKHRNKL